MICPESPTLTGVTRCLACRYTQGLRIERRRVSSSNPWTSLIYAFSTPLFRYFEIDIPRRVAGRAMDSEHGDAVSVEGESLFAKRLMIEIEAFRAAGLALQVSKHLIAVGYADRSRRNLALTADKPALKPFAAPRQDPRD